MHIGLTHVLIRATSAHVDPFSTRAPAVKAPTAAAPGVEGRAGATKGLVMLLAYQVVLRGDC